MNARLRRPAVALITTTLAASVLGIVPAAQAIPLGSISGDLTSDGVPITEDVIVVAYSVDDDTVSEEGRPDESGRYVVEGLEDGDYVVTFQSRFGTYVYEAWEDVTDVEQATPVTVGDDEPDDSIDADLALAGQIAGTVTDEAGAPLPAASVGVYAAVDLPGGGTDWDYVSGAETDESGTYLVDRLAAGTYRVDFDADGYQSEYYDDVPTLEGSEPVEVIGGEETPDIHAALTADATISGTVTDAQGQPLDGAWVHVAPVGSEDGEWARTDSGGDYTVAEMAAGTYTVFFEHDDDPDTFEGFLFEYYDNAGTIDDAEAVTVVAGQDETGIDAQLVAGEHDPVMLPYFDNVSAPVISGTAQVGATLTASAGSWNPAPAGFEYFWFAGEEYLQGGPSSTYTPTAADLGKQLTVQVAVTGDGYERTYSPVSAPTSPVVAAPVVTPPVVTPPVITPPAPVVDVPAGLAAIVKDLDVKGKPKVGSTLKVKGLELALRTAVSYKFQWFAGSKKIKKATKSKLKVTRAMKGKKLSVKVTATAGSTSKSVKLKVGKVK